MLQDHCGISTSSNHILDIPFFHIFRVFFCSPSYGFIFCQTDGEREKRNKHHNYFQNATVSPPLLLNLQRFSHIGNESMIVSFKRAFICVAARLLFSIATWKSNIYTSMLWSSQNFLLYKSTT